MANYNNELLIEKENEITKLKYHLSMINKLSLADGDINGYLDDINIESVLDGFDVDDLDLPG